MNIKKLKTLYGAQRGVTQDQDLVRIASGSRRGIINARTGEFLAPAPAPVWHPPSKERQGQGMVPRNMSIPGIGFCDQIRNGLVSCYAFNGDAKDGSGHGNHGDVYGATLTTDRYGNPDQAYAFDGDDDYIEIPHPGYLDNGTITMYFKFTSGGESKDLLQIESATGGSVSLEAFPGFEGGDFTFSIYDGGWKTASAGFGPVSETWYYIVTTWGSEGLEIYIDSDLEGTYPWYTGGIPEESINAYIGAHLYYSRYMEGVIDNCRIFNRRLSQEEIEFLAPY